MPKTGSFHRTPKLWLSAQIPGAIDVDSLPGGARIFLCAALRACRRGGAGALPGRDPRGLGAPIAAEYRRAAARRARIDSTKRGAIRYTCGSVSGVAPGGREAKPAMRIDSLRVENFRCFEDHSFTFDERFTLLVGANGAGKTALLDALAGAAVAVLPAGAKPNRASIQLHDVRRTYARAGETGSFVAHYPAGISAEGYVLGVERAWSRHRHTERSGRTRDAGTADIRTTMAGTLDSTHEAGAVELPFIGYYGTGRLGPEEREAKGHIIPIKLQIYP